MFILKPSDDTNLCTQISVKMTRFCQKNWETRKKYKAGRDFLNQQMQLHTVTGSNVTII